MSLTPAEIETAYRLALERTASTNEMTKLKNQHSTMPALRQILLNSEEFYRKFKRIRTKFEDNQTPILVHMHIPHASAPALVDTLSAASGLQPHYQVDMAGFTQLCTLPRPERLQMRYVHGDLSVHAGAALNLPWQRLCSIREPGPRIYAVYQAACAAEDAGDMSFGTFLDYSLDSTPHRIELDNGQVRRLAGRTGPDSFGHEDSMLRQALHVALGPDTILGLFEQPAALIQALTGKGFLDAAKDDTLQFSSNTSTDSQYTAALESLTADQRQIFDSYAAWDSYLYDVCAALISPTNERKV